jgi:hypothetical protein
MKRLPNWVLLLPAVAAGGSFVDAPAAYAGSGLSCDIQVSHKGDGVTLRGVVASGSNVEGSYSLKVTSVGSSSSKINQGGDFSVKAGGVEELALVTLGGDGVYQAKLSVTADGRTTSCTERVGGSL